MHTQAHKTWLVAAVVLIASAGAAGTALAETAVVVNPGNNETINSEGVANVFLGKAQNLTPYDQTESAPIRADFYKKSTDRDLAQVKAAWSRLVFSGKAQPPKELANSADVKKAVAADPKGIGYIDKSAVDSSVKVVLTLP